jgi:murein L,D-transpeptidase YcbB/YkuD
VSLNRILAIVLCGLAAPAPLTAQNTAARTVAELIATARAPWARWPDFANYVDEVKELYGVNPATMIWHDGPRLSPQGRAAIAALLTASEHGLDPRDYDVALLERLARESVSTPLSAVDRARFDLLLSVNLIRFSDDVQAGRLHRHLLPSGGAPEPAVDLAAALRGTLAGNSLPGLIAGLAPQLAQYRNLQRALTRYRQLASDTSLRLVPQPGPILPGDTSSHVSSLRRFLRAIGDLDPATAAAESPIYGAPDVEAMRRFQSRHGLQPTGAVDSATLKELSTPLSSRVRQIELALERLKWLPPIGQQPFLVVNIPAFQLFAFDSAGGAGAPALTMRVIVGKALDKQTPVLLEMLRYVEFRPAWNVPRSILMEEIVPILKQDSGYLRRNNMEIVGPRDRVMKSAALDDLLDRLTRGELRLRQRPGAGNPLGLTKFVFPNAANVYLHGTPQTDLFAPARRDFSHGCVRIEDPAALAEWVLRDQRRWPLDSILAAQRAKVSTRALLTRPMPVIIFYTTAVATPDGRLYFYPDVYGHDRNLEEAIRAGPT